MRDRFITILLYYSFDLRIIDFILIIIVIIMTASAAIHSVYMYASSVHQYRNTPKSFWMIKILMMILLHNMCLLSVCVCVQSTTTKNRHFVFREILAHWHMLLTLIVVYRMYDDKNIGPSITTKFYIPATCLLLRRTTMKTTS